MDEIDSRLNAALDVSNYRLTLNLQRQNLKLEYNAQMMHAVNGGIFTITPSLISFVSTLLQLDKTSTILLDDNMSPIEIENVKSFLDDILDKYYEASNQYYVSFRELNKKRSTSSILGL